ncbi:MAG: hypothetical protein ACKO6B_13755 [Planctomycetia bacterium]
MNTYRIYEDFKATLGDAAAKSLAQTLGTMFDELKDTVTKEDFRILRESIDTNISRLDGAITRLAEAQTRTESKVTELAEGQSRLVEAQARTEVRMNELAQAQARTEVRMNELAQAQARTEQEVRTLAEAMQRLTIRTDAVIGRTFEIQFRDRLSAYLGRFLRRGKVLANDELLDAIESRVTESEVDDFLRADMSQRDSLTALRPLSSSRFPPPGIPKTSSAPRKGPVFCAKPASSPFPSWRVMPSRRSRWHSPAGLACVSGATDSWWTSPLRSLSTSVRRRLGGPIGVATPAVRPCGRCGRPRRRPRRSAGC